MDEGSINESVQANESLCRTGFNSGLTAGNECSHRKGR